ncbi:hypothetical protein Back11_17740 [Paenibacillus baekrokdamisoli]|uniref:Uncharacterized protein n=1 Tax=Paenibacillus baekrokdamisoli TaxID=1712516 RepID=A0A3G9JBQ0_9BACL|nr:hypothetical protein [Paenibacillus baekrokdamisoli]MBB3073495.1 magnesium-transporting ATPase (P-type) [Paenibacillus baekrokdamisoli]BBH20429.1 hypothetical protein Back11_17740 [Paenibacillus baekrokdamisoli]
MEIDVLGLRIYIIYLMITLFLGYKVAIKTYLKGESKTKSIVIGFLITLIYIIVGYILWSIFCFTSDIGFSIDTFPLIGLILGIFAFIISAIIFPVAFLLKIKRSKEERNFQEMNNEDQF